MPIVNNIELIVEWAEREICSQVLCKLPDDDNNDAGYDYKLVKPAAFALFVPTRDRLPPKIPAPIPSLCVQLIEGKERQDSGTTKIRFGFSTWNPGTHYNDLLMPKPGETGVYVHPVGIDPDKFYERNMNGWRDAWNFVDIALRVLGSTEIIENLLLINKSDGIEYGPFMDRDSIPDFYPYWFAWCEFSVSYGTARRRPQLGGLL